MVPSLCNYNLSGIFISFLKKIHLKSSNFLSFSSVNLHIKFNSFEESWHVWIVDLEVILFPYTFPIITYGHASLL